VALFGKAKEVAIGGAIEGLLARAGQGTIFFDEVGHLPLGFQAVLFRVLDHMRYFPKGSAEDLSSARFVFSTSCNLDEAVKEGRFLNDLYYSLQSTSIYIPPLRCRLDDIPELLDALNRQVATELGQSPLKISDCVVKLMTLYEWPGNIRELKCSLEGIYLSVPREQEVITPKDLSADLIEVEYLHANGIGSKKNRPAEIAEVRTIIRAWKDCGGLLGATASLLGIHRNTLRIKMEKFGLKALLA